MLKNWHYLIESCLNLNLNLEFWSGDSQSEYFYAQKTLNNKLWPSFRNKLIKSNFWGKKKLVAQFMAFVFKCKTNLFCFYKEFLSQFPNHWVHVTSFRKIKFTLIYWNNTFQITIEAQVPTYLQYTLCQFSTIIVRQSWHLSLISSTAMSTTV